MLNREQELLRKIAAEKKKETDIRASLAEFAALVSSNLKRILFENKQKLLRIVLDKVAVNDWKVDVWPQVNLRPIRRIAASGNLGRAIRTGQNARWELLICNTRLPARPFQDGPDPGHSPRSS